MTHVDKSQVSNIVNQIFEDESKQFYAVITPKKEVIFITVPRSLDIYCEMITGNETIKVRFIQLYSARYTEYENDAEKLDIINEVISDTIDYIKSTIANIPNDYWNNSHGNLVVRVY